MISSDCAEPVAIAKHGRPNVVVMAVDGFERLKALEFTCPNGEEEGEEMTQIKTGSL